MEQKLIIRDKNRENERLKSIGQPAKYKDPNKIVQGDTIETPEYVEHFNLKPDYLFYITNQLSAPISELLSIFENGNLSLEERTKIAHSRIFGDFIKKLNAEQRGNKLITSFFK